MMMKRNQVIITALVVMIGVAGYLNYADTREAAHNETAFGDHGEIGAIAPFTENGVFSDGMLYSDIFEIGEALTMDDFGNIIQVDSFGTSSIFPESAAEDMQDSNEAVFVNTTVSSPFFVQAKLEREQSRARQKEILMSLINDSKIDAAQRAVSADAMLDIQKRIERETAAEAMIESKGFKEVYVRIGDDSVDVVVNKEALSDAEIAQIEDIVKRKTGMDVDKIRISAMRR